MLLVSALGVAMTMGYGLTVLYFRYVEGWGPPNP